MKVTATIKVLGKVSKPWRDKDGVERKSFSLNFLQDGGQIVDTIKISEQLFNSVIENKDYTINADYGTGANGGYLRITAITESK